MEILRYWFQTVDNEIKYTEQYSVGGFPTAVATQS